MHSLFSLLQCLSASRALTPSYMKLFTHWMPSFSQFAFSFATLGSLLSKATTVPYKNKVAIDKYTKLCRDKLSLQICTDQLQANVVHLAQVHVQYQPFSVPLLSAVSLKSKWRVPALTCIQFPKVSTHKTCLYNLSVVRASPFDRV